MPAVNIHGSTLHYQDHGTGFPLLLGHSYLWDAAMWAPQIDALSRQYRVIVPDLWGHGASGALLPTPRSAPASGAGSRREARAGPRPRVPV